jgi:hypothetical protein
MNEYGVCFRCRSCEKWIHIDKPGWEGHVGAKLFSGSLKVEKTTAPREWPRHNVDPDHVWDTAWGRKLRKYGGYG